MNREDILQPGLTIDQAQEQIREMRRQANLPVPSLDELLRLRGVPERLIQTICGGAMQETAATRLALELAEKGGLLVLAGDAGRGKTTAAALALSRISGLFVRSGQLAVPDTETTNLDLRMRTCRLLVVDDLGVEHSPSGFAASRLEQVVIERWDVGRRTILTTNLTAKSFRERYGDRIASRANAAENTLGWRDLDGPDLRRANA